MNDNKGIAQKVLTESQLEGSLRSFLGTGHEALFARAADAEQFRRWAISRLSGVDELDRHLPLEIAPGVPLRYRVRDARRRSGADPLTPPADAVAGVASLYASLAEAERQREVLAEALREIAAGGRRGKSDGVIALDALRECGLLRPQDDPSQVPSVWLNPNEEND